jgi:hypothetical protein
MNSNRLDHIYRSRRWRDTIRPAVLRRAGGQCEARYGGTFGEVRCPVRDKKWGGTDTLYIDHIDPFPLDLYDVSNLQALCPQHSGRKSAQRRHCRSCGLPITDYESTTAGVCQCGAQRFLVL